MLINKTFGLLHIYLYQCHRIKVLFWYHWFILLVSFSSLFSDALDHHHSQQRYVFQHLLRYWSKLFQFIWQFSNFRRYSKLSYFPVHLCHNVLCIDMVCGLINIRQYLQLQPDLIFNKILELLCLMNYTFRHEVQSPLNKTKKCTTNRSIGHFSTSMN